MVAAQSYLVKVWLKKLVSVAGGSMGGMHGAAVDYILFRKWSPPRYRLPLLHAIPLTDRVQRSRQAAIMADPDWKRLVTITPEFSSTRGLSVARMIGHITYMSDVPWGKFGSGLKKTRR